MLLLHQLLAIEKGTRARATEGITELHRQTQQVALLQGTHRKYTPTLEGGTQYPDEVSPVTLRFVDAIEQHNELWSQSIDLQAQKDYTNQHARADVKVDDRVILEDVPATHLLYLERQIENLRTFLAKIVELPAGVDWRRSDQSGLHESGEKMTIKTEKVEEALVLYQATERHPAQAEKIVKDKVVGHWTVINSHGGIPAERKRVLLRRVNILLSAVKIAREEANRAEVLAHDSIAQPLLEFVFED